MGQEERIEVRKFYVGRAALFGLLYGLFFGLIFGIVLLISILLGDVSFNENEKIGIGFGLIISSGIMIFSAILSALGMAVSALIYNLIVKMGGAIHLDLAELDDKYVKNAHV